MRAPVWELLGSADWRTLEVLADDLGSTAASSASGLADCFLVDHSVVEAYELQWSKSNWALLCSGCVSPSTSFYTSEQNLL